MAEVPSDPRRPFPGGSTIHATRDTPVDDRVRLMVWLVAKGINAVAVPAQSTNSGRNDRITDIEALTATTADGCAHPYAHGHFCYRAANRAAPAATARRRTAVGSRAGADRLRWQCGFDSPALWHRRVRGIRGDPSLAFSGRRGWCRTRSLAHPV